MQKIQGAIFDMDGTLIDSEPLWQEAEIVMFAREGLLLTRADCAKTKGLQPYEAMKYWHGKLDDPKMTVAELTTELNNNVVNLVIEKGRMKEGVMELLDFWKETGLPLAIASASPMRLIEAVVDKFKINKHFDALISGDHERFGKPHPAIYITAAKRIKVDPVYSVAFEDSFNGMIAAKAARLKLVALLDEGGFNDTKYDFADLKLESFHNFGRAQYEYLESIL
jgi:beta-phosphoglucomutase-like phosphatase (HAD superfamily)